MIFFNRVRSVSVEEAGSLIAGKNVIIIDVRSPNAYEKKHIDGALLADKVDWDAFTEPLDKSKQVICYCYKGFSSKTFCKRLLRAGFKNVVNLKGGYDAWEKEAQ